jgi:hypothetical protein
MPDVRVCGNRVSTVSAFFEGSKPSPCYRLNVKTLERIEVLTRPAYDPNKQTAHELEWRRLRAVARGKAVQKPKLL